MSAYEPVSTWKQIAPSTISSERADLLALIAAQISGLGDGRLRIAIDGYPASGKTVFADQLAAEIRNLGRPTLRTTLDNFKHPWRDSREKGYDRKTAFGYYKNAPDFDSTINLLLGPAGPEGSGKVALCGHDPLTGIDHREVTVDAPKNSVLIVDSMFAFRPEYNEYWDFRIWLEVPTSLSLSRGIERDKEVEGLTEAEDVHLNRYHEAERIYMAEADPLSVANLVIDNSDFENLKIIRAK